MKYLFFTCFLATMGLSCLLLNGCSGESNDTTTDGNYASSPMKLVVGTCAEFPPFEFFDTDGSIQGIDIDIMKAIADKLGKELVIENLDFSTIFERIAKGTIDVGAAGITVNEKRKKSADFTIAYYSGCQVIVIPNRSEIKGIGDLEGKVVAVQAGTTGETLAKKHNFEILSFPRASDVILALLHNNADAAIMDDEPAKRFQTRNSLRIKVLPDKLTVEVYGFAVNKNNPELLDNINHCIDEMKITGELEAILEARMDY